MGLSRVTVTTSKRGSDFDHAHPARPLLEQHWNVVYTCRNHEKCVGAELHARAVEHFLPLYSSARRWKDRQVTLELPLFPGYVLLRLALCDGLRVRQIPSVVRLVSFGLCL
jgi:transcription antitermination factor NusG